MTVGDNPILARLAERLGDGLLAAHADFGDATAVVSRDAILSAMRVLRTDPELSFDLFLDATGVDHLGDTLRFEVVYHLYSIPLNRRVRVKVRLPEDDPTVESVVSVYPAADWFEREAYDMYGIVFKRHPDLRRILMYDEFVGHPLRKDYPKDGRQPLPINGQTPGEGARPTGGKP